jgi:hypothetical protein
MYRYNKNKNIVHRLATIEEIDRRTIVNTYLPSSIRIGRNVCKLKNQTFILNNK